ncbi:QsdR family transcriptional regulator [Streptomyces sp. NBC_01351]|uniref:QsdR family transcriptional regulator n=1 Tax=Streptomyces sp. NBC_01351 TaxID=2903833 RepID=UPI002E32EA56|nr:QsdR family transcriptional regulator [Streptomyces sp. NBC_01351]
MPSDDRYLSTRGPWNSRTSRTYVITRIGESFVYADLITGDEPDATKPAAAVAALLR